MNLPKRTHFETLTESTLSSYDDATGCLPIMLGHPDPELRQLAMDELAYWAGDKYERLGDLRGAAGQFRVAASHGLGDAQDRLAQVLTQQNTGAVDTLSEHSKAPKKDQRKFLSFFAALTMGVTPSLEFGDPWLPASDLAPWPVLNQDIVWLEHAARRLWVEATATTRTWRQAAITATSWGEHLLGSNGASDYSGRLESSVAELHILAGCAASSDGALESARAHFARAAWLANLCDDHYALLNVLFRSGVAWMQHRQPDEAIKYHQLAQIAAQDLGASRELIVILAHETWCYRLISTLDRAADLQGRMDEELQRASLDIDELIRHPPFLDLAPRTASFDEALTGRESLEAREVPRAVEKLLLCPA